MVKSEKNTDIPDSNLDNYVTKAYLDNYLRTELSDLLNKVSNFAVSREELGAYATKADSDNFLRTELSDLLNRVSKAFVSKYEFNRIKPR